jgi:hypothetical protein
MRGQWITRYEGSNSGTLVAEFDEIGDHYEGTVCVWDDNPELPNSWVSILTQSTAPTQKLSNIPVIHIDNNGDFLTEATVRLLNEKGITIPATVDAEIGLNGDNLSVRWTTSIGTFGSAVAPRMRLAPTLNPLAISRWDEFKSSINLNLTDIYFADMKVIRGNYAQVFIGHSGVASKGLPRPTSMSCIE